LKVVWEPRHLCRRHNNQPRKSPQYPQTIMYMLYATDFDLADWATYSNEGTISDERTVY
jgi:hypothetical protein